MFEYKLNNKLLLFHIVSKIRFCVFLDMEDQYDNFINLALILDNLKVKNMFDNLRLDNLRASRKFK